MKPLCQKPGFRIAVRWWLVPILLGLLGSRATPAASPPHSPSPSADPAHGAQGEHAKPSSGPGEPHRVPPSSLDTLLSPNLVAEKPAAKMDGPKRDFQKEIDAARLLRRERDLAAAAKLLLGLLDDSPPPEFRRAILFDLAMCAQEDNQLGRAQQILAQYLTLYPTDPTVPEVLLRQGLLYRKMGANTMAVSKFYAVMNSALGMQADQFDYYKRLVLQAQTEIADTYHQQGRYQDAIDFYKRIIKQNAALLNKSQLHFKYIRCLTALGRHAEAVPECEAFFKSYPNAPESPELRFLCADSLRQLGRRRDAMLQVLELLESQKETVQSNPDGWTYWQQKAGNQIANEFYKDGDYINALEIYTRMSVLSTNITWQAPVLYQIGIIHERLQQPALALEYFEKIIAREKDVAAHSEDSSLATILEMARWRKQNMGWQNRTEVAVQSLKLPKLAPPAETNAPPKSATPPKSAPPPKASGRPPTRPPTTKSP